MAKKNKRNTSKRSAKSKRGALEHEIFKIMQACMKEAINAALDDILKE